MTLGVDVNGESKIGMHEWKSGGHHTSFHKDLQLAQTVRKNKKVFGSRNLIYFETV